MSRMTPEEIRERADAVLALFRARLDDEETIGRLTGLWAGLADNDAEAIIQTIAARALEGGDLAAMLARLEAFQAAIVSGPQRFALRWIQSAGRNQVEGVWPFMTSDLRLAMVQDWLLNNPEAFRHPSAASMGRDDLAHALTADDPQHELFVHVARVSLRGIRNSYGNLNVDELGTGWRPRPMGADLELVRLLYLPDLDVDETGSYVFAPGAAARGASVLVRRAGSAWAVAGFGVGLFHPGWPPRWEEIVNPDD
jgi:hypothetical protein